MWWAELLTTAVNIHSRDSKDIICITLQKEFNVVPTKLRNPAALQMVHTQTVSASGRGSDPPSQRPLTKLHTSPPVMPDQSIRRIPEEPGHSAVCVRCLSIAVVAIEYEDYLWFRSWACPKHAACARGVFPCMKTAAIVFLFAAPKEPGGIFLTMERKEGGQWRRRAGRGSPTWKREHSCSEQIKGRAPIQNTAQRRTEGVEVDNRFQTGQTFKSKTRLIEQQDFLFFPLF